MKTISKEIMKSGQSVNFKEVLNLEGKKIRILIKSDSYADQSYAKVELWNGSEWNNVDYIQHANMQTPHKLKYEQHNQGEKSQEFIFNHNLPFFKKDRDHLLKMAKEIIS